MPKFAKTADELPWMFEQCHNVWESITNLNSSLAIYYVPGGLMRLPKVVAFLAALGFSVMWLLIAMPTLAIHLCVAPAAFLYEETPDNDLELTWRHVIGETLKDCFEMLVLFGAFRFWACATAFEAALRIGGYAEQCVDVLPT